MELDAAAQESALVVAAAVRVGFEGPISHWRIVGGMVEMWDFHGRYVRVELVERPIILEVSPSEYDLIDPPKPKKPRKPKS